MKNRTISIHFDEIYLFSRERHLCAKKSEKGQLSFFRKRQSTVQYPPKDTSIFKKTLLLSIKIQYKIGVYR